MRRAYTGRRAEQVINGAIMIVASRSRAEGLVRVGCACYTSDDEVERLIEAVKEISK